MKNNKKIWIAVGIGLVITILYILFINRIIYLSPLEGGNTNPNQNDFCSDSDNNSVDESKVSGRVLYVYKGSGCSWSNLNKINFTNGNLCAFSLTFNDYCLNSTMLKEKICVNNKVNSRYITCLNNCENGVCY